MAFDAFRTSVFSIRLICRLFFCWPLFGFFLSGGCIGTKKSPSSENLSSSAGMLAKGSSTIEAVAFHMTADSSRIYFRVPDEYLLFVREDSVFSAELEVAYSMYVNARSKQAVDTGSVRFKLRSSATGKGFDGYFDLKTAFVGSRLLRVVFVDVHRKQSGIVRLSLVRNPLVLVQQDHMLKDTSGNVIAHNTLPVMTRIDIQAPGLRSDSVWVRWYLKRFPLPVLPFRVIPDPVFSLIADTAYTIPVAALRDFCVDRLGVCYIQTDTLSSGGCAIVVCDKDFPMVTDLDQLIEGTRYLTTKSEYKEMNRPGDRKTTFDGFWLEAGGSAERARGLIRAYYNRMQKANQLYTSHTSGWRTDRGMVFMVFGEPQTIYNDGETEQWNYPAWPGMPDRYFIFRKMNNPFSDNDYALIRQPQLEWTWYHAVDQWRNGRIPQDD